MMVQCKICSSPSDDYAEQQEAAVPLQEKEAWQEKRHVRVCGSSAATQYLGRGEPGHGN